MVNIDRMHVKEAFKAYVSDYDLSDVKVKLKVDHTYRVAAMCDAITEDLGLSAADRDLAWLSGMLHDIGRFEQLRQYHTFQDRLSCNHAMLSADILFHDGKLRLFVRDAEEDELALLEKTIRLHNVYRLPEELSAREYRFATILRDADKIDILRVNCETPRSEIYDLPEEAFRTASISDQVYDDVMHARNVDRAYARTAIDFMIGHIAFVFGLVYTESFRQVRAQGYLDEMLRFQSDHPDTREKLKHIRQAIEQFIERRLLNDRQEYDTPIGKVCMSREEHEAYLEKQERYS